MLGQAAKCLPPLHSPGIYGIASNSVSDQGSGERLGTPTSSGPHLSRLSSHTGSPRLFPNSPLVLLPQSPDLASLRPGHTCARALSSSAPEVLAARGRKCAGFARGGGDGGGRFGCRPLAARRRARRPPLQVRPRAGGTGGRGKRHPSRGGGRRGERVGS